MSQPVPPAFKDIGKTASDLLGKDYPIGSTRLEVKTKASNGVQFKVTGDKVDKTGAITGELEGKYTDVKSGIDLTQSWTSTNLLKSQLELSNQVAKGLKLDFAGSLLPASGGRNASAGLAYKQPALHARAYLDLFKGPTFSGDAVVGRDGLLLGGEVSYDINAGRLNRYNLALGFNAPEYAVAAHALANLKIFSVSYYHLVNRDTEAGAKAVYDTQSTSSNVALEFGAKHYLDNSAFVKAKINNLGIAALGYTQGLRPGVKVSFGIAVDTQKLNEASAAHKLGTSFSFEG